MADYKEILYVQEVCSTIAVAAKNINSDVKKFYNKDDYDAILRMKIALDSLKSSVGNLETILTDLE